MKTSNDMPESARLSVVLLALAAAILGGCDSDEITDPSVAVVDTSDDDFVATDWSGVTHGSDADPDFDEVFADGTVKRIDLVVTAARWQIMLDDMTNLYGAFGSGGGGLAEDGGTPVFVPAEVFYEGREWYRVGIRFKGNSSLQSTWRSGNLKLSFKLDFDEFEDAYPQIANQRFYGFKQLNLKNNYADKSMLREKVAGDVFRDAGLPGAHTAFYTLYVDHGEGPIYFGVYTLVEEVDDTVVETQFEDGGNLYKPEGLGAALVDGTFSTAYFEKETNEDTSDWSDILSFLDALHDDTRATDAAAWREQLEAVFDTEAFLEYLAVNTVIQNWDTYGLMTHNYFLYNNPDTGLLTWINWDNNEALDEGKQGGALALDFADLSRNQWPLIEYLYADAVYRARYDAHVAEVVDGPFETGAIQALYSEYASLIEPFATAENPGYTFLDRSSDFQSAISELRQHVAERASVVGVYLR